MLEEDREVARMRENVVDRIYYLWDVKINFDGSVNDGIAVVGYVIRDYYEKFIKV